MCDEVVWQEARFLRRGVINWGYDFDQAVFHGDFNAEPPKFAAGLNLHIAEALRVQVA